MPSNFISCSFLEKDQNSDSYTSAREFWQYRFKMWLCATFYKICMHQCFKCMHLFLILLLFKTNRWSFSFGINNMKLGEEDMSIQSSLCFLNYSIHFFRTLVSTLFEMKWKSSYFIMMTSRLLILKKWHFPPCCIMPACVMNLMAGGDCYLCVFLQLGIFRRKSSIKFSSRHSWVSTSW